MLAFIKFNYIFLFYLSLFLLINKIRNLLLLSRSLFEHGFSDKHHLIRTHDSVIKYNHLVVTF